MSQVRQNYHEDCEAGINRQINMELYASYVYQSMAFHFDRDDVALKGFHKFFKKQSEEEREHAEKFMQFQNQRGGRIVLQNVQKPERDEWGSGLDAMQAAHALEKNVNQALIDLHGVADTHNDAHSALGDYYVEYGKCNTLEHNIKPHFNSTWSTRGIYVLPPEAKMADFIEEEFLKEQVESIKQISDYITTLKRVGPGLGEYMFDKETLDA